MKYDEFLADVKKGALLILSKRASISFPCARFLVSDCLMSTVQFHLCSLA
jgi:hypothetical protein